MAFLAESRAGRPGGSADGTLLRDSRGPARWDSGCLTSDPGGGVGEGLIGVEYGLLPAVGTVEQAPAPGAPRLHEDLPDDVGARALVEKGDVAAAFAPGTTRRR